MFADPIPGTISVLLALGSQSIGLADLLYFSELLVLNANSPLLAVGVFFALERSVDALLGRGLLLGPELGVWSDAVPAALAIFVTVATFYSGEEETYVHIVDCLMRPVVGIHGRLRTYLGTQTFLLFSSPQSLL